MRAMVVGVGYVGFPLAATLARQGHEVFGVRRSDVTDEVLRQAGVTPVHADIADASTLAGLPGDLDWVVLCAATGGGSVAEYRRLYVEGTRNLIQAFHEGRLENSLKRLVYVSSTGVYGQDDGSWVDETSAAEPSDETAAVLIEAERLWLAAVRERTLPAVILRAAGIYGPGRGYLLKQLLRGEARIEGEGDRALNMIHRDDLVAAVLAALLRGKAGEIYNVVDDQPVTQREFFTWLTEKTGHPFPPRMTEGPDASRRRRRGNKRIANRKLHEQLGCSLIYPTYREGYAAEIERLKNEDSPP